MPPKAAGSQQLHGCQEVAAAAAVPLGSVGLARQQAAAAAVLLCCLAAALGLLQGVLQQQVEQRALARAEAAVRLLGELGG